MKRIILVFFFPLWLLAQDEFKGCDLGNLSEQYTCCQDKEGNVLRGSLAHTCLMEKRSRLEWVSLEKSGKTYKKCVETVDGKILGGTEDVNPDLCLATFSRDLTYTRKDGSCQGSVHLGNQDFPIHRGDTAFDPEFCQMDPPNYDQQMFAVSEGKCLAFKKPGKLGQFKQWLSKKVGGGGKCDPQANPVSVECFKTQYQANVQGQVPMSYCLKDQETAYTWDKNGRCVEYINRPLQSIKIGDYDSKGKKVVLADQHSIVNVVSDQRCLTRTEEGKVALGGGQKIQLLLKKEGTPGCFLTVRTFDCGQDKVCPQVAKDDGGEWVSKMELPLGRCLTGEGARFTRKLQEGCYECARVAEGQQEKWKGVKELEGDCLKLRTRPELECQEDDVPEKTLVQCKEMDEGRELLGSKETSNLVLPPPTVKIMILADRQKSLIADLIRDKGGEKEKVVSPPENLDREKLVPVKEEPLPVPDLAEDAEAIDKDKDDREIFAILNVKDPKKKDQVIFPSFEDFQKAIQEGIKISADILSGKPPTPTDENVRKLLWYYSVEACRKRKNSEEAFRTCIKSGSLRFKDDQKKIFGWLDANPNRYSRISSHFNELQKAEGSGGKRKPIGIDFSQGNLPFGRRTLLTGYLDDGTTFIKMESHGMKTFFDKIGHALSFLSTRGEQTKSGEFFQKEHMPKEIKENFNRYIVSLSKSKTAGVPKDNLKDFLKRGQHGGMSEIKKIMGEIQTKWPGIIDSSVTKEEGTLSQVMKAQHDLMGDSPFVAEHRKGNEVFIDARQALNLRIKKLGTDLKTAKEADAGPMITELLAHLEAAYQWTENARGGNRGGDLGEVREMNENIARMNQIILENLDKFSRSETGRQVIKNDLKDRGHRLYQTGKVSFTQKGKSGELGLDSFEELNYLLEKQVGGQKGNFLGYATQAFSANVIEYVFSTFTQDPVSAQVTEIVMNRDQDQFQMTVKHDIVPLQPDSDGKNNLLMTCERTFALDLKENKPQFSLKCYPFEDVAL